jgi:hypothetical protein
MKGAFWLTPPCCLASWLCCVASCAPADPYGVGKTCPVEGQVFQNGARLTLKPGTFGRVWFHPDAGKGNQCPQVAVGDLNEAGEFKLTMRDQPGAPPGWYKVAVVVTVEIDPHQPKRPRKSFVNEKYGNPKTSKLAVQVVDNAPPGSYDLRLSK